MFCTAVIPVCCNVTCISSQNNLWPFSWYLNTSWGMLLMLQVTWHFLFINTHTRPPPSGYFGQSAALFTEVAMTSRKNASHWPDLEAFLPVLSITPLCVRVQPPHLRLCLDTDCSSQWWDSTTMSPIQFQPFLVSMKVLRFVLEPLNN